MVQYGSEKTQTILDADDSTETIERNIVDFKITGPIRHRFEKRVKVTNAKDEMTEYLRFSDMLDDGKTKLDPEFRIEYTAQGKVKGFYYVVKCWTELEMV